MSKQLLRSGTSIGAMVREAQYAESRKDFIHKLKIGLKEAYEAEYWLIILESCGYAQEQTIECRKDIKELIAILIAIINSMARKP